MRESCFLLLVASPASQAIRPNSPAVQQQLTQTHTHTHTLPPLQETHAIQTLKLKLKFKSPPPSYLACLGLAWLGLPSIIIIIITIININIYIDGWMDIFSRGRPMPGRSRPKRAELGLASLWREFSSRMILNVSVCCAVLCFASSAAGWLAGDSIELNRNGLDWIGMGQQPVCSQYTSS